MEKFKKYGLFQNYKQKKMRFGDKVESIASPPLPPHKSHNFSYPE